MNLHILKCAQIEVVYKLKPKSYDGFSSCKESLHHYWELLLDLWEPLLCHLQCHCHGEGVVHH